MGAALCPWERRCAGSASRTWGAAGRCPHGPGGAGQTGEGAEGGRSCIADGAAGSREGRDPGVVPGAGEGPRKAVRGTGGAEPPPRRGRGGRREGRSCRRRVPARAAERRGAVSAAAGRAGAQGSRRCGESAPGSSALPGLREVRDGARSRPGRCGLGRGAGL